jgi:hypothetical protein
MDKPAYSVTWRDSSVGPSRQVADLPRGGFASIQSHTNQIYSACIRFDGARRRNILLDIFPDVAHAENWVEGKAILLATGKPIDADRFIDRTKIR